jgi:hypothetical protein
MLANLDVNIQNRYHLLMAHPTHIAPDMTVRQLASASPACAAILESCPNARWAGRWTLQELAPFARLCGIDQQALLQRLSTAAGVPAVRSMHARQVASPIPLLFISLGIALTLGAGWGVVLLLRIARGTDYGAVSGASAHIHGVAQLWGWMTLFIFGVAGHLLRQTTTRPAPPWMERAAAALIVAGLMVFFGGLNDRLRAIMPWIDILGSSLLLIASVLFGIGVLWSLSGAVKTQRRHGFIFLIGWLWVWVGTDLWLRLKFPSAPLLPDAARTLLINLPVLGLGTNAIYGFGIRLIPGLLNIRQLRPKYFAVSLWIHNAGLCLFLVPRPPAHVAGAALMLAASVLYLIGMDGLRSKPSRPIYGIDPRGHILIRAAFFWLVCGLSMVLVQQFYPNLPHAYSGAWRHALTVGFITTMILGVGQRIIPVFIKQPLASTRLMLVGAALIIVGNAGRVALELATLSGRPWTYRLMGTTGLLELTALALFALNLVMTVRNRQRIYDAANPLTPDVRVREAVNARPELQRRLDEMGITMFNDVPFIAPSMTFGALALASGRQPWALLTEINSKSTSSDAISAQECRQP